MRMSSERRPNAAGRATRHRRLRNVLAAGCALLVAVITGCASSVGSAEHSGGPTSTATTPITTVSSPTPAIVLLDRDNGRSVPVNAGTRVTVRLASTYWQFAPTPVGALRQDGTVVVRSVPPGSGRCVPGGGCGTVSLAFHAAHAGRATIVATRRSCGEAMACTGRQGRYAVTIVVR
jgi:hypothetical protein